MSPGNPGVLAMIGVVGHEPMLHTGLTVRENIEWFAAMAGDPNPVQRTKTLLSRFRLNSQADMEVRTLSRGQQQRAGLARALVADPPLLLLDEPFTGLDEPARESLAAELIALRAAGKSVILTTHETALGLRCATSVCLLRNRSIEGPVAASPSPALVSMLETLGR